MKSTEELLKEIYQHFPESENPDETMSLLITDCIETGINYWCNMWPEVSGKSEFYSENVWEAIKTGESLEFGDLNGEHGKLNLDAILKSLDTLKKKEPGLYEELQTENWDAYSCDEFFQTAIFGEVVFG